jgi:hypothetical protein
MFTTKPRIASFVLSRAHGRMIQPYWLRKANLFSKPRALQLTIT